MYNVLSISAVQKSDPVIHVYTFFFSHYPPSCSITTKSTLKNFFIKCSCFTVFCQFLLYSKVTQPHKYIHSFSHIILHHVPSQVTRYSSLCCIAGSQTPSPSHSLPLGNHKSVLPVRVFLFCGKFLCAIY